MLPSPINRPPHIKLAPPPPPPFPSRTLAPAPRHCSATDSSTPLDTCCRAGQVMEVEASLRSGQLPRPPLERGPITIPSPPPPPLSSHPVIYSSHPKARP